VEPFHFKLGSEAEDQSTEILNTLKEDCFKALSRAIHQLAENQLHTIEERIKDLLIGELGRPKKGWKSNLNDQ